MTTFGQNRPKFFFKPIIIIYAPFESLNRDDSKYVVLKNVCIDFLAKTSDQNRFSNRLQNRLI
jgi:hypothetical protein